MEETIKNVPYQTTGSNDLLAESKTIIYPFDRFTITVKVSPSNEFMGITEVGINKDFMSYSQKIAQQGYHDVGELYRE